MAERPKYRPIWGFAASLIVMVLVIGAYVSVGSQNGHAQVVSDIPCFGTPADYVTQFDDVDGVTDGAVSYPEPRAFLETQSHLQPPGETSRHHFEHIHYGACYPYAETWVQPSNARTINARYVFHHVQNYNISAAVSSFVDAANSGGGYTATAAQKAVLEAAMDASATSTETVFQSYTLLNIGTSCRKTWKPSVNTVRANASALVDEWFAAGQWTSYINYPGQPVCNPEFQQDQIRSRSWILPNGGYLYTTVLGLPPAGQMDEPLTGDSLDFTVSAPGSGSGVGRPFSVYVDPDFHNHNPDDPSGDFQGIWHQDYPATTGGNLVNVSIPLADIPPGVHKVVVISGGFQSAIQVFPFKVAGTC